MQTRGIEVDDVGKVDVGFGFNQHVGRSFGKLHWAVLQIHVAEERDAVDGKPFDDGGGVGRAVQQVVVVVVRLQGIQQDIRVRLPLLTVAHRGLQAREGIHEERHGHVPIGAQQQVRVVPRATNDFSVCVNLSHDVLGVNFGVFVVHANPILVVGVESFSDFCDVPERHGPKVRVSFVHGPVVEPVEVRLVEPIVDGVSVLVVHHVSDQRSGIAPSSCVEEVDASSVVKGIAFSSHVDVHRHAPVQIRKLRQPRTHVVVDQVGAAVGTGLLGVSGGAQGVVSVHHIHSRRGRDVVGEHRGKQPFQLQRKPREIPRGGGVELSRSVGEIAHAAQRQLKVRHGQRLRFVERVRRMRQSFDLAKDGGRHGAFNCRHVLLSAEVAHVACDVLGSLMDDLVGTHHDRSCGHVHPSEVADGQNAPSTRDVQLPNRMGIPSLRAFSKGRHWQPCHAQILHGVVGDVGGPRVARRGIDGHV